MHSCCKNVGQNYQIASINESEDRDVWSFMQCHTNLSYLASVPNFRNKHLEIRKFSMKQFELQTPISQLFNAWKSQYFACELFSDRLFGAIE